MSHPRRRSALLALFSAAFLAAPLTGCSDCHGDFDPLATAAAIGIIALDVFAHDSGCVDFNSGCPNTCAGTHYEYPYYDGRCHR